MAVFGKTWDMHVTDIIKTSLDENLNMISDTVAFFFLKAGARKLYLMPSIILTDIRETRNNMRLRL